MLTSNSNLPVHIRKALPNEAQTVFREAYNEIFGADNSSVIRATHSGWNAVKKAFHTEGGKWVRKENPTPSDVHSDAPFDGKKPKRKKGDSMDKFEAFGEAQVLKVDEELGLVFGWAIVCKIDGEPYFDTQGDHIPEDALIKATLDFAEVRVAGDMHQGEDVGSIPFIFPLTTDVAKSLNIETPVTGLLIAMRPSDPEILEKFRSGDYTGFSIGGRRIVDEEVD